MVLRRGEAGCSELGLGLLEVLDRLEAAVARVLDHLLALPVGGDDRAVADAHSRHLEGEEVHVGLLGGLPHRVVRRVEDAAVLEEAAREAAEDDDLVLRDLHDARALSLRELRRRDVDDDPRVRAVLRVVPLDRVAVFFARLGDSAEDKHEPVVVSAA